MGCIVYSIENRVNGSTYYSDDEDSKELKRFDSDLQAWFYMSEDPAFSIPPNIVNEGYFYEWRWLGLTEELRFILDRYNLKEIDIELYQITEEDYFMLFIMGMCRNPRPNSPHIAVN